MKVSVVIPALNEEQRIGGLLKSLKEAPYPQKEIIVVVDLRSKDRTREIAEKEGAKVILDEEAKGPGYARNKGAKAADGEILCFMDADEKGVNLEFFEKAMKHFEKEDIVAVSTNSEILPSTLFRKWYIAARDSTFSRLADSKLYGSPLCFTFIRRDLFLKLGGFFPIGTGEEEKLTTELAKYLASHPNKKIVHEPRAIKYDGSALTFREYFRQSVWYGRSSLLYFRVSEKNLLSKFLITVGPLVYAFSLTSLFLFLLSRWFLFLFISLFYTPKLVLILADTVRDRKLYRLLTPVMDLLKGYGHLVGLLDYVARRTTSR